MAAGDVVVVRGNHDFKKGNYFDGTDDYVLHDAHAVARVAAGDTVGTYTAWIYLDNIEAQVNVILSAGDNNSASEFLQLNQFSGQLQAKLNHGSATQWSIRETTGSLTARTWTHIAIVQNGTRPTLYVNGLAVAMTDTISTDLTDWYNKITLADKFAIGVLETNATHLSDFTGAIGQVKYFNIDLSAEEILVEFKGATHTRRASTVETARVFDITMENDGITDDGSGADNGTLTGDAHYGGEISTWTQAIENQSSGHAAEFINTIKDGPDFLSVIKRGD